MGRDSPGRRDRLAGYYRLVEMIIGQARLQLPKMMIKLKTAHADLIIIASHGLTDWRRLVFGSVAKKVVRQATCPVLTIVAPPEAEQ